MPFKKCPDCKGEMVLMEFSNSTWICKACYYQKPKEEANDDV